MTNGNKPIVQVEHLVAHYGETLVLDDISFEVARGEIFLVIGGSGCGKTTLIKHITGLLKPTSGTIVVNGVELGALNADELADAQRKMGIAFQGGALFNSMTVGENVALPLREYGNVDKSLIPSIVRLKLSMVGLEAAVELMPDELSGGMRKRAGLARAMATDPPLVFFDEPSAGLDPIMASGLDELILRLRDLLGLTFVIVTHELDSIRKIADRILMLDRGKAVFVGTLAEMEASDAPRLRQFFERRADNFIKQRNI